MLSRMGFQPKRAFLPSDNELPPWAMSLGLAVAVGVIYFLAARLSLALISRPDGVAVFWPAAGVASGVLIGLGPAARLPVIVGTVAATIVANVLGDRSFWSSLVFALCNAGEAVVVALLIQRFFGSPFRLESVKRVFGLVAAAIVATALSGAVATLAYKTLYASPAPVLTIWRTWFVSDALGIITIAPLLIGVFSAVRDRPPPREALEGFLALVCVAALAFLILRLPSEAWAVEVIIALFFPLSLWIAARCQPGFAAAAVSIVAITVVWSTTYGTGVFGNPALPVRERVLTAQAIILATTLGALILAALFAERRRHEAIVVENAERLQSALQIGGVMAFSWWVREGTTQRSENAAQMMGYDPDQPIPAESFLERIHPEDHERFKAYLHDVSPENPSYVVAFRYMRPDGREIWFEETAQAEFDAARRVVKMTGLTRDVTERKRAEAELAASRKAAETADRAKSAFLAAASHDLRQPLQSLTLLTNALKPHLQTAGGHLLLGRIARSLDVMKDVLDSLLDINRLETGVLNPSKSNFSLLGSARVIGGRVLRRGHRARARMAAGALAARGAQRPPPARADVAQSPVQRVALHRAGENHARLPAQRRQGAHRGVGQRHRDCRSAHRPHLRRALSGRGPHASRQLRPRARDRAAARKPARASRRGAVAAGRGLVLLDRDPARAGRCEPGERRGGHARAAGRARVPRHDPGGRGRLLRAQRHRVAARRRRADVVGTANGHEALELVTAKRVRPELVLSDFNLPGRMNGVETIQALRKALAANIPAIVLTGDIRSEVLDAIALHDVRIATKPVNADQLIAARAPAARPGGGRVSRRYVWASYCVRRGSSAGLT